MSLNSFPKKQLRDLQMLVNECAHCYVVPRPISTLLKYVILVMVSLQQAKEKS